MTLEAFVSHYGLLGLFVGSGVEGEAVVVTGGVLAQRHLIPLGGAMAAAAAGSCIVDQIWFFIGRRCRRLRWVRTIMGRPPAERALNLVARYPRAFVFGFRFVYGLRTISPIAIGASEIPTRTFVLLNLVAAAIWGPLFILVGYAFGSAAEKVLGRVGSFAPYALLAALAAVCAVILAVRRFRGSTEAVGRAGDLECDTGN